MASRIAVALGETGKAGVGPLLSGDTLVDGDGSPIGGGGISDGDKGDLTVSSSGTVWTIDAGVVGTSKLGGDITVAGKALLDDADASAQRTTLGLGTLATQSGTFSGTSSGLNTGDQDLSALAPKASPALTGTPTAPTASLGTNTTQIATTAFVLANASGADQWTNVVLGSDFTTTSATAVSITGMLFTPAISKTYEFECWLFTRTATTTVGVRPGCSWPTGCTDGVVMMQQTSAAGTSVLQNGNINAAVLAPVGGNPNTTQSWPGYVWGTLITGGSASGNFQMQVASETAGTTVTIKAGSYLRYRQIA